MSHRLRSFFFVLNLLINSIKDSVDHRYRSKIIFLNQPFWIFKDFILFPNLQPYFTVFLNPFFKHSPFSLKIFLVNLTYYPLKYPFYVPH